MSYDRSIDVKVRNFIQYANLRGSQQIWDVGGESLIELAKGLHSNPLSDPMSKKNKYYKIQLPEPLDQYSRYDFALELEHTIITALTEKLRKPIILLPYCPGWFWADSSLPVPDGSFHDAMRALAHTYESVSVHFWDNTYSMNKSVVEPVAQIYMSYTPSRVVKRKLRDIPQLKPLRTTMRLIFQALRTPQVTVSKTMSPMTPEAFNAFLLAANAGLSDLYRDAELSMFCPDCDAVVDIGKPFTATFRRLNHTQFSLYLREI